MNLLNIYFIINIFLMGGIWVYSIYIERDSMWSTITAMITTLLVGLQIFSLFLFIHFIDSIKRKKDE